MTNPVPPERRRHRLRDDEPIAILVALLAFGGIFAWAFGLMQGDNWLNAQNWLSGNLNTVSSLLQGESGKPGGLSGEVGNNPANGLGLQGDTTQPLAPDHGAGQAAGTDLNGITAEDEAAIGQQASPNSAVVGGGSNSGPQGSSIAPVSPAPSATNDSVTLKSGDAVKSSPGATTGAVPTQLPAVPGKPIAFKDLSTDHWASAFIAPLSASGVVAGFQDGSFKPDEPITRSQFASYVAKTTTQDHKREFLVFKDVPKGSEQGNLIEKAVRTGFMSGYSNGDFRPQQLITRMEAIIAAATGLDLPVPANPETILSLYEDRDKIPDWAKPKVAAATQAGLIANYPNVAQLRSDQPATRAEVATMFYQILVRKQQAEPIDSKYLVRSAQ